MLFAAAVMAAADAAAEAAAAVAAETTRILYLPLHVQLLCVLQLLLYL